MDKQQLKLTRKENSLQQDSKMSIIGGSIIATLIAITPYVFYLYESVPATKVWDTFLFTYESTYYEDANWVAWIFIGKAVPLLLMLIWFFTCRHWWYHVIIVPIAMYTYQLFGLFNDDYKYIDEFQLTYLIPVMAIIIPSIYLLRAKMFNKLNNRNKTMEELEEEFTLKPRSFRDYF